jgi:hypothetical protein
LEIGFADTGTLHIVDEGELALRLDADPHAERVTRRDVILLPRGDPHHIGDAGKRDPQIGPALSAIHREPGHDWTVEGLARTCSLAGRRSLHGSRVASGGRRPRISRLYALIPRPAFSATPPFGHTHRGERRLYTSEAAFSRAFKYRYGTPPTRWRHDKRAGQPGGS